MRVRHGQITLGRSLRAATVIAAVILLVASSAGLALAHKGKLPPDALSLARQASALLAQDPKMSGEARERLEAALTSKDSRGVDLAKVRQARDALAAGDVPAARRALAEALTARAAVPAPGAPPVPETMPMASPPSGQGVSPPPVQSVSPAAGPTGADPMAAMRMAEPLVVRFSGTPGEFGVMLLGLALGAFGFAKLRRGR